MLNLHFKTVATIALTIWVTTTLCVIFGSSAFADNIVSFTQIIFYTASFFTIKTVYSKCNPATRRPLIFLLIAIGAAITTNIVNYYVLFILHHPNFFMHPFNPATIYNADKILHFADYIEMLIWYIIILIFLLSLVKSFYIAQLHYKIQFTIFATLLGFLLISILYLSQPVILKHADFYAKIAFISSIIEIMTFLVAIYGIIHSKSISLYLMLSSMVIMIFTQISALFYYSYPIDLFLKLANISGPLWIMLLLLTFIYIEKKQDYDIQKWFIVPNSLEARLAFSALVITNASFIIFFSLSHFLNIINQTNLLSFFLFIITYSLVAVLAAKRIAQFFTNPFQQLQINIEKLISSKIIPANPINFDLEEFNFIQNFIYSRFAEYKTKVDTIQILSQHATQAAHDIRSPLAAINIAAFNAKEIPENRRIMLRNASKRINDIANNLLLQTKMESTENKDDNTNNLKSPELIFSTLDSIISEKKFEYQRANVKIDLIISSESYNCFAKINAASFKRVLSNLINNSIEASDKNPIIIIRLSSDLNNIKILIEDNGCGIPPEFLSKITEHGFSYNKLNGTGFGLAHAKEYIDHLHGKLTIQSEVNSGTKIFISLPKCNTPNWFCESLNIIDNQSVIVLDDDTSIHDAWEARFSKATGTKISHFHKASDLTQSEINKINPDLCLIDYELLTENINGLDISEHLNLNEKSILVSSCFDCVDVQNRCEKLGIKIIPKSYVPFIPITLLPGKQQIKSAIFIDNDELIRMAWEYAAKVSGITISTYKTMKEFMKTIDQHKKNTPIYIDSELDDDTRGEILAKTLFDLGFSEIYLSTGHPPNLFQNMPWIKSIINKTPPF